MVKPNDRERKQVLKIDVITPDEVLNLKNILMALGFDYETIALVWNKSTEETQKAFNGAGLSGSDLLLFCETIWLRPGVVQQRLNFNQGETRIKTQKVGLSSTRALSKWIGPPEFCLTGNASDGRAFREVYQSPGVAGGIPDHSQLDQKVLQQIGNGNRPVHLPQLIDLVHAALELNSRHPKLSRIKSIMDAFPEGIRTLEDVFAPAETVVEKLKREKKKMNESDRIFAEAFAAKALSEVMANLIDNLGLASWAAEVLDWEESDLDSFHDNEAGPLPKELDSLMEQFAECQTTLEQDASLKKLEAFIKKNSNGKPTQLEVLSVPEVVTTKGHFGEVWDDHMVVLSGTSFPLTGQPETVLSKCVYRTLLAIRDKLAINWTELEAGIGVNHAEILRFSEGSMVMNADAVKALLQALKAGLGVDLTIEELFGLKEISAEAFKSETSVETCQDNPESESTSSEESVATETATAAKVGLSSQDVPVPIDGWPQMAISSFVKAFVGQNDSLKLKSVLEGVGLTSHSNSQVFKGNLAYSRKHLEGIAEAFGISFAELVTANISSIKVETPSAASSEMQNIAAVISEIVKTNDKVTVWSVLQAAGVQHRPHNSFVMSGKPGYSYTEEQLVLIATELDVSVSYLKGREPEVVSEEVVSKSTVSVAAQAGPEVNSEQTEAIGLVWTDGGKLAHIGPKNFAMSAGNNGPKAIYRVLKKYMKQHEIGVGDLTVKLGEKKGSTILSNLKSGRMGIREERAKTWSAALGLTMEQLFGLDALPVMDKVSVAEETTVETTTEVGPAETETIESVDVADTGTSEDSTAEVQTPVEQLKVETEPVAIVGAGEVDTSSAESHLEPSQEGAPAVLLTTPVEPKQETPSIKTPGLDWRKIFFSFATAGYIDAQKLAVLWKAGEIHGAMVDWKEEVRSVAGTVLSAMTESQDLETILADKQMTKLLSELSSLETLILAKEIEM